uniref:LEM domain-containing protein n=1 Tax=Octopus bimaculoides TaxID=37653 RepID=A0A0L8FY13_OCTBM
MAQNYAHEDCIKILQRHSQKLKSKLDAHMRQLKRSRSLNEKTKPTSSRYVHQMPSESFNASQYVTADSDPEEYESLEMSKSKPSFSILKRTQNGLVHHSKDKQFDMRKSVSTESYEEKYISKNTGYQSSNRPIPALRRRTGNIANLPEKFKDTEIKSKKESEVSSEMFLTPAASSPRRHRHRPSRRYHSDDDSPNVSSLEQISSSEEEFISSTNTTTDSDLYITVNETPQKPVFPRIDPDLSIDLQKKMEKLQSLKIPIAHKIEQLRNCLNKLENNQLSASLEQILHESLINESKPISVPIVRESYPPTHSRLWNGRHREGRTQPTHSVHKKSSPNNVDIKLSMDIPSGKIYVNERNIKKSKHRGHQTYEIHLDSSESTEKSSNRSKDDSVIDIKLKPKKKSHKKIYVVNPPHGSEFPTKYEKFEYLNSEYNDKSKLVCNEPSYKGPYPNVTENNHNRNNPKFYNHAAGHTEYLSQQTNQNGWGRGQYIDERCDRIVANTTSSVYQKIPRSNAEKTSCNKEKQRQEPSRMRESGHPSGHLYPKLTTLTDNDDESCENRNDVRCVQIPSRLQHQQQNAHLRTVSGRDHLDGAIEETIVKQVFRPPCSKSQAVLSKRTQEFRKPDSQVLTHAEVHQEEEPSRNKISTRNKNFRFGGRVIQKPCHKDIAAKTTVPMVMNTPLNPQIARCKLYETESAVQNMDVKRTESDVSCATTDTYVTCRTIGSENSEEFFSCDDGTNESALESKFESILHSFSSYLKKQLEQSNSQESSNFQDFQFNTDELSKAMLELNLKEGNDSSIDAEAYMSMLSRIEDQIITEPQRNGQESISLYTSHFKSVNTPENSCYISTSEQCQPVNSQQVVHRQSVSPELKCYEPKESKYNSALLPRESDEDSLYLVCNPNNSSAAQFQSFDEPDCKHLVPKPPKLLPKLQQKKYSANRDRDSNETEKTRGSHSSQFSQVMSELQGKFQQKAAQPNTSVYRWQPPDYILKSKPSCSANKAVGSTISSSAHQENLKRNVGLELKNHPLVKKFNRLDDGELSLSCVENSCHFYSCETSGNANCSNIVSEPIVTKSNDVPPKIERTASRSHFVSFEEKKKLHCKPSRKQERLVDLHSYYTSVQEEDGLDYSRYVSVQEEEEEEEEVDSRYVSVQGEAKPADSQYLSFQEDEIPNSRYLSVQGENQPFTSQSHYLSAREETEASSSKHHSMLTQNQNKSVNSQSHFLSAQEDGLGISKINHIQQRRKRIPQNSHSGCKQQSAPQNEPVTLQTRFTSPTDNCGDQSHYESVQGGMMSIEGQYFSTVQDSSYSLKDQNLDQSTVLDKSAINSQWQYVSASSGFHNRSVTWQNPISTYDEPDAVVVVSTDDSLSWSPGKDGHPPQIPPFTSTSASEDVTSGSTSSDGLKKCLASKEFLSPEKRTTMWVNGLYKIEEYFDQNISSINPVTSQSSSSDNVNNMKKIAANANRPQPSAPPKSEVFSEFTTAHSDFNAITDISTVAVAGTTGDKSDPLTPSSRSPQRPTLYPSLHDPLPNPASSPTPEEHLSDYSEKYPGSIIDHLKQPNLSETLDICSSSGATSGSIERFLTPYQEENEQAPVGFDEVDFMPTLSQANKIIATVHYGETYRSCIKLPDKHDKDIKFIHIDPERHINFIERRISVEPESSHSEDSVDAKKYFSKSPEETSSESSDELFWKSYSKAKKDKTLTDSKLLQLQSVLKSHSSFTDDGLKKIFVDFDLPLPGPITSATRGMYINRLKAIANGTPSPKVLPSPDYPVTLRQAMRELPNWTETVEMEQKMVVKFENSKYSQKRKGGNLKHFFTYLLLDPRVTKNLPLQASKIGDKSELFRNFVHAIFYVGKGTRDRPYSHLYDAMKRLNSKETKNDEKLSHIIDIWNDERGVISLHCFQGVTSEEAHSREACILDVIGLANLTNKMRGTCYGLTAKWSASQKRKMGTYWLYKAFQIFLAEGERQIFPIDLDYKS